MKNLLPLLFFVCISSHANDTILVTDNYADRSKLFDNSLLLLWGANQTPTSAFEIKSITDSAGLTLSGIGVTSAATPYSTYYDSVSHKPSLKTATCYDYALPNKINRSAKKITIEFDAIWNKYSIPSGEAGRIVITLVNDYPAIAPKFGDIDSAHQEPFGYPVYNLRILNSGSSSNQTFMLYGGGKSPNGEFEKRTENGHTYWLPGFSSQAGGTAPGQPDSLDYPNIPTKKSNLPFIQGASIKEWRHFTWVIEPEMMKIYKRATKDNESKNELISSMLIPKYEEDSLSVINQLNNEYGTNISMLPTYYKWFPEFNSVRVYLRATNSNFGYVANFKCTMSDDILSNTELAEIDSYDMDVYPNPASRYVTVRKSNLSSLSSEITLNSVFGQLVYKTKTSQFPYTFDVSAFSKGVYILSVKTGNSMLTKKLSIQ